MEENNNEIYPSYPPEFCRIPYKIRSEIQDVPTTAYAVYRTENGKYQLRIEQQNTSCSVFMPVDYEATLEQFPPELKEPKIHKMKPKRKRREKQTAAHRRTKKAYQNEQEQRQEVIAAIVGDPQVRRQITELADLTHKQTKSRPIGVYKKGKFLGAEELKPVKEKKKPEKPEPALEPALSLKITPIRFDLSKNLSQEQIRQLAQQEQNIYPAFIHLEKGETDPEPLEAGLALMAFTYHQLGNKKKQDYQLKPDDLAFEAANLVQSDEFQYFLDEKEGLDFDRLAKAGWDTTNEWRQIMARAKSLCRSQYGISLQPNND